MFDQPNQQSVFVMYPTFFFGNGYTRTNPPPRKSMKVERLRDFYDLTSDCNKLGNPSFGSYFTRITSLQILH